MLRKFRHIFVPFLLALSFAAPTQAQNQPPACGTISNKRYTNPEWWAGLEYQNYIRSGTPGACEAPGGKTCYWVDCDAVVDGDGSFANPFWGFETVAGWCTGDGCVSSGDFTQGLAVGGDWIYVKGTCDAFNENATGPFQAITLARKIQHGTQAEPTVITSWANEAAPVFDGGFSRYVLIWMRGDTDASGNPEGYVNVNNVRVTRYATKGIEYYNNVKGGTVNSVEIYNGTMDGLDGVGGSVVFYNEGGPHDYHLTNSYIWNIQANPQCSGGSANNCGAVTILSEETADPASTVTISNTIIEDTRIAIRQKHSGPARTVVSESLVFGVTDGLYVRQKATVQKSIFQDISRAAIYLSEENYEPGLGVLNVIADKNTFVDATRLFVMDDYEGAAGSTSSVAATNNIWEESAQHDYTWCLNCFGSNSPSVWTFSDITHANSMYNIPAGSQTDFAEIENVVYNFATFMSNVSDGVSIVDDAEIQADCSIQVGSPGASFATDGGPIGAVDFVAGGVPTITVNNLTTSNPSPALSGTVSDGSASIQITVDGNTYNAVNNGSTWTLAAGTITPDLSPATYSVTAEATNASGTGTDGTSNELTITGASSTWIGTFLSRICPWCGGN